MLRGKGRARRLPVVVQREGGDGNRRGDTKIVCRFASFNIRQSGGEHAGIDHDVSLARLVYHQFVYED